VIYRIRFAQNGNNEIAPLGAEYEVWHTPKGDKGLGLSQHLLEPHTYKKDPLLIIKIFMFYNILMHNQNMPIGRSMTLKQLLSHHR